MGVKKQLKNGEWGRLVIINIFLSISEVQKYGITRKLLYNGKESKHQSALIVLPRQTPSSKPPSSKPPSSKPPLTKPTPVNKHNQ